ncbi:microtubule-associated protein, partial [Genlisea aurea]
FKRRGSMVYTKAPSRDSIYKKEAAVRSAILPVKKGKEAGSDRDGCGESFSVFSSRALLSEKDREEVVSLRDELEVLKKAISEKDEQIKSAEVSNEKMAELGLKLEELNNEAAKKESMVKSIQSQLSDAKVR